MGSSLKKKGPPKRHRDVICISDTGDSQLPRVTNASHDHVLGHKRCRDFFHFEESFAETAVQVFDKEPEVFEFFNYNCEDTQDKF